MRTGVHVLIVFFLLTVLGAPSSMGQAASEPEAFYVFPIGGQQGTALEAEIRGRGLGRAYAVWFEGEGLEARIKRIEAIELDEEGDYKENSAEAEESSQGQRILLEVGIDPEAKTGPHSLRVISESGVSNSLVFLVNSDPVILEAETPHNRPAEAQQVVLPAVVNGKIGKQRGLDYYGFDAFKGQELAFEIFASGRRVPPITGEGRTSIEGIPKMRWFYRFAQGGRYLLRVESLRVVELVLAATVVSFVPRLTLHETTGSWLNPTSAKQLMFADDGRPDFASQVAKTIYARTLPDFGYQLRIVPSNWPSIYEGWSGQLARFEWHERDFRRKLESNRLQLLQTRTVEPSIGAGGESEGLSSGLLSHPATDAANPAADSRRALGVIKTYDENEPNGTAGEALEISLPALVKGAIERPGDADIYKFKVSDGQPLAFEIETPGVLPPQFYPRIEVHDVAVLSSCRMRTGSYPSTLRIRYLTFQFSNAWVRGQVVIFTQSLTWKHWKPKSPTLSSKRENTTLRFKI